MIRLFLVALLICGLADIARAESGIASVYDYGRSTASGERFNPRDLTAAHRTLPFGTLASVCRHGGNCIVVRINDRGPFVRGRIIDLTPAGERALGFDGLASVTVTPISLGKVHAHHHRHHRVRIVRR